MSEQIQNTEELVDATDKNEAVKDYFPKMAEGEFAIRCLGKAWDVVTDGLINIMSQVADEEARKTAIVNLLQPLRHSHINTVSHTAELLEQYQYHITEQRNFDPVVEFILQNQIIAIKNNYTAVPRASFVARNPETDKDPNWRYDALPVERIFSGERVPVKVQTNQHTIYGWYECLNHQVASPTAEDPNRVVNVQTNVPCIRVKAGNIAPNAVWRWQEVSKERLKQHWLAGEDMKLHDVPKAAASNPIDTATNTEGKEDESATTEPSGV